LGVGALTGHSYRANFTITNPNNFLSRKVSALHSILATLRGGPSIGHGCTHVHPIIFANKIEVSR
jgi:hypothetical protein